MKKLLLIGMMMTISATALAGNGQVGSVGNLNGKDLRMLEGEIELAIKKDIGSPHTKDRLKGFQVMWDSSLQCVSSMSEMAETEVGACIVDAFAYQLAAKVVIIKKLQGYDISVIYAEPE